MGRLADKKVPQYILQPTIKFYSVSAGVNLDEAEVPSGGFDTFGDFFARRLKKGARKLSGDEQDVISPCDGRLTATYNFSQKRPEGLWVKGYEYSLEKLLGEEVQDRFRGGHGEVFYLSPGDYHRVHVPMDASLFEVRHIPGSRFPVAPWSESRVDGLYEKNERMVFSFEAGEGFMTIVMVAAFGVGNISSSYNPPTGSNASARLFKERVELKKGEELGVFRLGSTVVVLWSSELIENFIPHAGKVLLGQKIATVSGNSAKSVGVV